VNIGPVVATDLPAISALHTHFWGEASDVDEMARALERLATDRDHIILAARLGEECVGTVTGVVCHGLYGGYDSYLVVEDVVVDSASRRQGVATALLAELESRARLAGCKQVILLTESVRSDAVAFYRSAGYGDRWLGFKKTL
jgi:GNAT superfamily N-acetyltransferase